MYECLFACVHVCVSPGTWATIWVLGMESRSSTGVTSALTMWVISLVPKPERFWLLMFGSHPFSTIWGLHLLSSNCAWFFLGDPLSETLKGPPHPLMGESLLLPSWLYKHLLSIYFTGGVVNTPGVSPVWIWVLASSLTNTWQGPECFHAYL